MPLEQADVEASKVQAMQPNMHLVVGREIKPRTKPFECSLALVKNPNGLRITTFVTHTWEEPFDHFTGTLEMALNPNEVVWICSIALDQNADIKKALDSEDLLQSPFAKALRFAPKLIVAMDAQLQVPERSWCVFELEKASQWAIPTFVWPYQMMSLADLEEKVDHLDVRKAKASVAVDQERIHRTIRTGSGYDALNRRLRAFLGDRLRFYEASVRKHIDQFACLSRDMETAHREKDSAWLHALEAQSLGESRLVQLEMERDARKREQSIQDKMEDEKKRMEQQCQAHVHEKERLREDLEQVCCEKSRMMQDLHDKQCEMSVLARRLDRLLQERNAEKAREKARAEEEKMRVQADAGAVQELQEKLDIILEQREKEWQMFEETQKQVMELKHRLMAVQRERDAACKKGKTAEIQLRDLRAKLKLPTSPRPDSTGYPPAHDCLR